MTGYIVGPPICELGAAFDVDGVDDRCLNSAGFSAS